MSFLSADMLDAQPFAAFLADIAAVGVYPVASGGDKFVVIGARSNARWWLVPLSNRRATAAGLDMLQPSNWQAALAKRVARLIARIGPRFALGPEHLRLSDAPVLVDIFGQAGLCCAYFTGTDGPHRKTAVQIMTASGKIVGYAKITRNPWVKPFLENEAVLLRQLSAMNLRAVDVPRLISYRDGGDSAWLVTDSLRAPGHVLPYSLGTAHFAFLAELAGNTVHYSGADTLTDLARIIETLRQKLTEDWTVRLCAGISRLTPHAEAMPVGLAHGDFTPWNSFLLGKRLYVFDWEYAHPAYPLGYDQVHFTLSANRAPATTALVEKLDEEVASQWFNGDRAASKRAVLFSLLLHAAFYLRRACDAGGRKQHWDEAERRAWLIDALISRVQS